VRIADHGYDIREATAFFPLYPLVVHGVSLALGSTLVAGVLVSLAAAAVAAVCLHRIALPLLGRAGADDAVLLLALYPVAFVFTSVYSDGLFLALATGSFLAAVRGRPLGAGVLGGLAVATRSVGLALLPALLLLLWPRGRSAREYLRLLPLVLLPAALGAYMLYLDHRFDDPFLYERTIDVFWHRHVSAGGPFGGLANSISSGWHGSIELARHLPRGLGAPDGYAQRDVYATWNVLHLALLAASLWLTWLAWRRLGAALGLYAVSYQVLLLAVATGYFPLASYPRYLLGDFPLFLVLADLLRRRPRVREVVLIAFASLGAVATVAFSRHVWVA
jgi:hypothetical protein